MKQVFTISFVMVMILSKVVFAQIPDDLFDANGGAYLSWTTFSELESLNNLLTLNGFAPLSQSLPMYGYWVKTKSALGWRFGGLDASGEITSAKGTQQSKLEFQFGGVTADYGLLISDTYDLSVGILGGGGKAQLSLFYGQPSAFEEAIANPITSKLEREFFVVQPNFSVGFSFGQIRFQIRGAYVITFTDNWKQNGTHLPGPPHHFNGWCIELLINLE